IAADIVLSRRPMDFHSNGMVFGAFDGAGSVLARRVYYSVGGGFVVDEDEAAGGPLENVAVPYPFRTGTELVAFAVENRCGIADL
ncbi:L-serine ammonia-lyase, partial [Mycobacterium sp. ITM-2017-0098]